MKKIIFALLAVGLLSCNKTDDDDTVIEDSASSIVTSVVQSNYLLSNDVSITESGTNLIIRSTGLPEHKTPYWGEGNALYEAFPNFTVEEGNTLYDDFPQLFVNDTTVQYQANANTTMVSWNYAMTIPANPTEASNKEQTDLGLIGLALNGVPIYNDYEGPEPLGVNAITTFDFAGAHPGPQEDYHYHTTGKYTTLDDDNLVGFLRDGFPLYGRKDMDGSYPTDLDENGGHVGVTADFSGGIYHYHTSNVNYLNSGWYVLKAGAYHGTPGTFTN